MSTLSGHRDPPGAPAGNTAARRRFREPAISRIFLGGLAGTAAITLMMYLVDPLITGRTWRAPGPHRRVAR